MKWFWLAVVLALMTLGWWLLMDLVSEYVIYPISRKWARKPLVDDPYARAMELAREDDWRGRRFLDATEQVAEIEGELVDSFEAGLKERFGSSVAFLNVVDGLEELHKRVVHQGTSEREES